VNLLWDRVLVSMPITFDCTLSVLRRPSGTLSPRGRDGPQNRGWPGQLDMIRVTQLSEYIVVHQSHN